MIKPILTTRFPGNRPASDLQDAVSVPLKQMEKIPLLSGREISSDLAAAVGNEIKHGLGKTPSGWILTDITAGAVASVWRTSWDEKNIVLWSNVPASIKLWIF